MIQQDLIDILCCPKTKQSLTLCTAEEISSINEKIKSNLLKNSGGELVEELLESGLVREDKKVIYPIKQDIPVLLIDEGIILEA